MSFLPTRRRRGRAKSSRAKPAGFKKRDLANFYDNWFKAWRVPRRGPASSDCIWPHVCLVTSNGLQRTASEYVLLYLSQFAQKVATMSVISNTFLIGVLNVFIKFNFAGFVGTIVWNKRQIYSPGPLCFELNCRLTELPRPLHGSVWFKFNTGTNGSLFKLRNVIRMQIQTTLSDATGEPNRHYWLLSLEYTTSYISGLHFPYCYPSAGWMHSSVTTILQFGRIPFIK